MSHGASNSGKQRWHRGGWWHRCGRWHACGRWHRCDRWHRWPHCT